MNNKGQIGNFVMVFVGIIVALALFLPVINQANQSTEIKSVTNETFTAAAASSTTTLTGRELVGSVVLHNATDGTVIDSSNISVATTLSGSTDLSILATTLDPVWASQSVNATYDYQPDGYVKDAAGRATFTLILIMSALAIALFAFPNMKEGIFGWLNK